jgi:hypothetical protein
MNDFILSYKCIRESNNWFNKPLIEINHAVNDTLTGAGKTKERAFGIPITDMASILNRNT